MSLVADRHSEEWRREHVQFNVRLTPREREYVMDAVRASGLDAKRWLLAMAEQSQVVAPGATAIPQETRAVILDGLEEAAMLMGAMAHEVMDIPEDLGPPPETQQAYLDRMRRRQRANEYRQKAENYAKAMGWLTRAHYEGA